MNQSIPLYNQGCQACQAKPKPTIPVVKRPPTVEKHYKRKARETQPHDDRVRKFY